MPERRRDQIPAEFESFSAAAAFWDDHDLASYDDQATEVEVEVDLQRRVVLTALLPELAKRLAEQARRQGVSTGTLVNCWLTERLDAVRER